MKSRALLAVAIILILLAICLLNLPNSVSPEAASTSPDEGIVRLDRKLARIGNERTERPPEDRQAKLVLPEQDREALMESALDREQKKISYRFATPVHVGKRASEIGVWERENGIATWQLEVESQGATSLNFALDEFKMPPGGEFHLVGSNGKDSYTFTSADNDEHGELWTPIVRGASAIMELRLPEQLLPDFRFRLATVNHGFRNFKHKEGKIGGDTSGSCNVDVVCGVGDVSFGDMIDHYRDQIRSVGAYTINGTDTCTGALINNTNNDSTPYFLTANHCGVTSANDQSMVVYWNFENSTCRTPGSGASGGVGDGNLTVFNSGSILRATSAASDFCLVELDDPVNPNSDAFFAGWNRAVDAPSMAVGIHHPAVAEKRISFEYNATTRTGYGGSGDSGTASHIRVSDWDEGTTEGGSSGSPLFDENGYIVGQLHGGNAACGNNSADWYGRFFQSWTGGITNAARLSNWLDPASTGATTLEGINLSGGQLSIADVAVSEGNSGTQAVSLTVTLSETSASTVTCQASITGGNANSGSDYVNPGSETLTFNPGSSTATYDITINGDTTPEENETIIVTISNPSNAEISQATATLAILNDDFVAPLISGPTNDTANQGISYSVQIQADNTPTSFGISGEPTGMTVDPLSGIISWPSPVAGAYSIGLSATNSSGTGNGTLNLTVSTSDVANAFEIPATVSFAQSGDYSWVYQTSTTLDGTDALIADGPGDSTLTHLDLNITGPDQLLFMRKVSTEQNYDFFRVRLDGTLVASASGEDDWAPVFIDIPSGSHTVRISYEKDGSVSSGSDAVWIDHMTLASGSLPEFNQRVNIRVPTGVPVAIDPAALFGVTEVNAISLPSGVQFDQNDHIRGTFTTTRNVTLQAFNSYGSTTRVFTITPYANQSALGTAVGSSTLLIPPPSSNAWFTQTSVTRTGGSAIRSGIIPDSGTSSLTTHIYGPGTLSFYWRSSTESGYDFGYLKVNSLLANSISGISSSWQQVSVPLRDGLNEITWEYIKDSSESSGADAVYVDDISLSGFAGWVASAGLSPFFAPPGSGLDGDNNPALLEYAVNQSAATTEPPILPTLTGTPGSMSISTPVNPSASGISVDLQKSTTLQNGSWITLSPITTSPILEAMDTSGDEKAFYRINVTSQ